MSRAKNPNKKCMCECLTCVFQLCVALVNMLFERLFRIGMCFIRVSFMCVFRVRVQ